MTQQLCTECNFGWSIIKSQRAERAQVLHKFLETCNPKLVAACCTCASAGEVVGANTAAPY